MARKIVALIVAVAFSLFEVSCLTPKRTLPERTVKVSPSELPANAAKLKIVKVVLQGGEAIAFEEANPAKVSSDGGSVVGMMMETFEIDKKDILETTTDKKGRITRVLVAGGETYYPEFAWNLTDTMRIRALRPISIPLSDIHQVWFKKTDVVLMAVLVPVVLVGSYLVISAMLGGMSFSLPDYDSCPFVYSFDGEAFVLDAEPYGAAVSEGLKRTDWVELSNLRELEAKYRLLLANELDETQYTDELKLVAVDHVPGASIAPDLAGRIHTFSDPQPPLSAVDQTGRDILTFVRANDQVFWLSDLEERNPDGEGEFRDDLTFEFPKPAGAKQAKLLANVWTTQWGSFSAGKFMELYGSSLEDTYEEVDRHGPMYGRLLFWMAKEELYNLKVWVETPSGWKQRALIMGGAPVITKDKAYILDVSDVPGEVLRLKLRPPVNFWMVNSLAVDYSEDSPVNITEIVAESAVDHTGRDARAVLAETDSLYIESPNFGERTALVFAAPPLEEDLERTVLVKASGYYKVHLDASGAPRTEIIGRVFDEPGFAARYSLREYQKWEAGILAKAEKTKR